MAPEKQVVTQPPVDGQGPYRPPMLRRRLTDTLDALKKKFSFKTESKTKSKTESKPPPEWLLKGARRKKSTFRSNQLKPSVKLVTSQDPYEFLCSYTWTKGDAPTIYVPGDPPQCVLPERRFWVKKDSASQLPTVKEFPLPRHSFEPAFRAMELMNPNYKFNDIDVLTTRHSLRKLLKFSVRKCPEDFRLNLYMIDNTLIVERSVEHATELLQPEGDSGWGHNFEKSITRTPPGMKDIGTHHRLLRYGFGSLNCAVLSEVDAACDVDVRDAAPEAAPLEQNDAADVKVIRGGIGIPHDKALEIKSKNLFSFKTALDPLVEQLWFGRTQKLIWGRHSFGLFECPRVVKDVESKFAVWEERNSTALLKVAGILTTLRDIVSQSEGKACIAFCQRNSSEDYDVGKPLVLQIYDSVEGKLPLPKDLSQKFWGI